MTSPQVPAGTLYRLTDLGPMNAFPEGSVVIGNTGEITVTVTGDIDTGSRSYFWRHGRRLPLETVGNNPNTTVFGINDHGEMAGSIGRSGDGAIIFDDSEAVVWEKGKVTPLAPADLRLGHVSAVGVNNKGQIVGDADAADMLESVDMPGGTTHGLLWRKSDVLDLGLSTANALNDQGVVVGSLLTTHGAGMGLHYGSQAARWEGGRWHELGTLPGWTFSVATAINAAGAIVGSSTQYDDRGLPSNSEACLWQNGAVRDLGPGQAVSINAHGQIVGSSAGRAVLWWRGRFCDLNSNLPSRTDWLLTKATGINDRGQIVGLGSEHGKARAFLLTPLRALPSLLPQTAAMRLKAAPTGPDKVTLYWKGVPGAFGYDVYRCLSAQARMVRVNTVPVQTRDPGPGVRDGWMFTDQGLTDGTDYTYTVVAIGKDAREVVRSNPGQATPNPDAIPWDTGNATLIVDKIWETHERAGDPDAEVETFANRATVYYSPPTAADLTAPDGVVYADIAPKIPPCPYTYRAQHQDVYTVTDLGKMIPYAINGQGVIVGSAFAPNTYLAPAAWQNGKLQLLPLPPGVEAFGAATGINDAGDICGYGPSIALLWSKGSVRTLPALLGDSESRAYGINDAGVVVGSSRDVSGRQRAVFWDAQGNVHDAGSGSQDTTLSAINDKGTAVGTRVVLSALNLNAQGVAWSEGTFQDIPRLGGAANDCLGVNAHGDIVGWSNVEHGNPRSFLDIGGRVINLGMPPDAFSSRADGVNDSDEVVGTAIGKCALLWHDGQMSNLNDLVTLPPLVTLTEAVAINDRGQICAVASSSSLTDAYLLTPK